jgi:hypothetical protein
VKTSLLAGLLLCLTGCINYPRTHVLVTPFAVAGIHSFAPVNPHRKDEVNLQAHDTKKDGRDQE